MNKPRVLVTFDSMKYPNSGLFYFGKSLGNALIEQNNDKFDLTYYTHKRAPYRFDDKAKLINLSKLHKLIFPRYNRFDLVHFTDQYCRLKPNKVRAKRVLTIHDMNPVHEQLRSPKKMKKYLDRLGGYIDLCDKVVAISRFVAGDILKYFPQAENKIRVIYNGADKLKVKTGHQPAYLPRGKFLFTIGHVSAKKNFHVLPALLEGNDCQLIIAGIITPYQQKIFEEATKYNCGGRVVIAGTISDEDRAWYYQNCEAFVFPSVAEGFGLPVIEAMNFGKPVFLSTHTSLPEIGGDKAYYFDSFEGEQMQQVFSKGMEDFEKRGRAAEMITYAERFNWNNTALEYLSVYRECLG